MYVSQDAQHAIDALCFNQDAVNTKSLGRKVNNKLKTTAAQ